jgi:hypothetical protein
MGACVWAIISPPANIKGALTAEKGSNPQSVEGWALIDTGAATTAVDESVCQKLGVAPTGEIQMGHAGGSAKRLCYPIQIVFPQMPMPPLTCPSAASVDLAGGSQNYVLLVGRDLLAGMRLVYNGPMGRIEISV